MLIRSHLDHLAKADETYCGSIRAQRIWREIMHTSKYEYTTEIRHDNRAEGYAAALLFVLDAWHRRLTAFRNPFEPARVVRPRGR